MQPNDRIRLCHMLDAAMEAVRFTQNRTRQDLDHDRQLEWALVKAIEIVGEAAGQLSEEAKTRFPDIPWQKMTGMRNRLVHAYFHKLIIILVSTKIIFSILS